MSLDTQIVGAFGEKAVEAELLRRGWRTANYNTSIKNAAHYDMIAWKDDRAVQVRVKTCGPGWNAFQFSSRPGQALPVDDLPETDYTILTRMGDHRGDDCFWVIPTITLRKQINAHRQNYLDRKRRDGKSRQDIGQWTLRLRPVRGGEDRPNYDFEKKWESYRDNWNSLYGLSKC